MAKKRPPMSVELANATSAEEVAQIIADSWIGYGLETAEADSGDSATVTVTTKPETWKTAQRALWLKPVETQGNTTIYRMSRNLGMNYELQVTTDGAPDSEEAIMHTIIIKPAQETKAKEVMRALIAKLKEKIAAE